MRLICKKEALAEDGSKILNFTKGELYYFKQLSSEEWETVDDSGTIETFFDLDIMFDLPLIK